MTNIAENELFIREEHIAMGRICEEIVEGDEELIWDLAFRDGNFYSVAGYEFATPEKIQSKLVESGRDRRKQEDGSPYYRIGISPVTPGMYSLWFPHSPHPSLVGKQRFGAALETMKQIEARFNQVLEGGQV